MGESAAGSDAGNDGGSARGSIRAPATGRIGIWRALLVYLVLQGGGLLALAVGFAVLAAARPLLGSGTVFLGRWSTSFVLVPVTFVPALVAWHGWALRRFGRRPTLFRFTAEVAFAAELIGCVLYQRLA